MIAVKKDISTIVYSVGKTGTTSLLNVLDHEWFGTGEYSADFMHDLCSGDADNPYKDRQYIGHNSQYNAVRYLSQKQPKIYCVVRDPWKRYISGLKEVLADSISSLGDNSVFHGIWSRLISDQTLLAAHIDRLYYLSEYRSPAHKWAQFALHQNYHMRNWLHEVKELRDNYSDTHIILNTDLDNLILNLGLTPGTRQNVSQAAEITAVEQALTHTRLFATNNLQTYLNADIELFNQLLPNSPVKKLELV